LIAYEKARDELVQRAADIARALDSRNQNGVVAGVGGAAAAAGAGLLGSTFGFSKLAGAALLATAVVILLVSGWRARRDWGKANRARKECCHSREAYLTAKGRLMDTCPHECWPVFVDVPCQ